MDPINTLWHNALSSGNVAVSETKPIFGDTIKYEKIVSWQTKNPCTVLNEYCQITFREWSINVTRAGQSHSPTFTAVVTVSGYSFKSATGSNKKEARKNAAKEAMDVILKHVVIKF
ncbi:m29L [Myxoma virus]|uniref:M29L n=1 Tax=Myxoma virus TaxID=10273 RepID=K4J9F8_9POXV|nr:m29L [Myxoma virus]AFU77128.1 m29L [Myxoma virus]AFU78798.1 m29L [Myxoma virus]AFU79131.1 m29L [Myxoma virus]AFU79298.1 m29L [Myxoma virus]